MFGAKELRELRKLDRDDLLEVIGLQRKSSADWVAPAVTALGVGILVGAGLGLLLAPKEGRLLREDLRSKLKSAQEQLPTSLSELSKKAEQPPPRTA
jgi:hypothetical protein